MTVELIEQMTAEGWDFQAGPHVGVAGYYAVFFHEKREDADDWEPPNWEDCGHAFTFVEAAIMAHSLATGQITSNDIPPIGAFRR